MKGKLKIFNKDILSVIQGTNTGSCSTRKVSAGSKVMLNKTRNT